MVVGAGYNYEFDADGNMTANGKPATPRETSPQPGDKNITTYAWDNRNRLVQVTSYDTYAHYHAGIALQTVTYIYDASDRWVGKTVAGATTTQTRFIYDGNQIVLQFDGSGTLAAGSLSHRYLWGPAVNQLLADEQVTNTDQVLWALTDNENTVRDLVTYTAGTPGTTTVVDHRIYSAFGKLLSTPAVDCIFGYTGRPLDTATDLQNNDNRWYNSGAGDWLSQDPDGFGGGDDNLYGYCDNGPTDGTDPTGEASQTPTMVPGPTSQPGNNVLMWPPVPAANVKGTCTLMFCESNVAGGLASHTFLLLYVPGPGKGWMYFRGGPTNKGRPYGNMICNWGELCAWHD